MTITKRLGIGYAIMAAVCLALVTWLGYHEFLEEKAGFAERGLSDLHKDTAAKEATVIFLGLMPVADAGVIPLERKPVSLREIVQEATEDAVYLAQPRDVQVTLDECDAAIVTGDQQITVLVRIPIAQTGLRTPALKGPHFARGAITT